MFNVIELCAETNLKRTETTSFMNQDIYTMSSRCSLLTKCRRGWREAFHITPASCLGKVHPGSLTYLIPFFKEQKKPPWGQKNVNFTRCPAIQHQAKVEFLLTAAPHFFGMRLKETNILFT